MLKLLKNLKSVWIEVLLIIIMLCVQAVCDLKLPSYTSNIVNVGIQQSGIEYACPNVIRKSQLNSISYFTSDEDYNNILSNYSLMEKSDDNISKYPILQNEDLYELKDLSKDEKENLSEQMAKPLMILNMLQNEEYSAKIKEQLLNSIKENQENAQKEMEEKIKSSNGGLQPIANENISNQNGLQAATNEDMLNQNAMPQSSIDALENMSARDIIFSMPKDQVKTMVDKMTEEIEKMSSSIIEQGGISFVKAEYEAIGVDIDKISNKYILNIGLQMLGISLISMISAILVMYFSAKVGANFGKETREKVFKKVLSFSNEEFNKFSTASLITRSTNDIQQIQMLLAMLFRTLIYAPIMAIGGIIMIRQETTNFSMTWIIILAVVVIIVAIGSLFITTMPKFKLMQTLTDKLNSVSREILTGIPVIRAFNTQAKEEKRFDEANTKLMKNSVFVNNVMSLMMPMMSFVMQSVMLLIIWVGGHNVDSGVMQVGDMMAFMQYAMQIIMSFLFISVLSIMLPRASISANRINEIIDTDEKIKDLPETERKHFENDKKGLVEFKNVSFQYPDGESEVISDINFTAKPGETTAIIGGTGSGKSTIVNLIPRFYDVTSGEIDVDGANIKKVSQKDLHKKIGFVPQKGLLFSGTIESNIKFGSNVTDEQMKKVAKISQSKEFIDTKPDKYNSEIAQGGNNVSGGQKQRLSIARALAIDPEILVFDDSFSALDMKTDRTLRDELKKNYKDKTIIIVAQRIGTIMDADQIVVLDDGKVVGIGKHDELLKNCKVYKDIALSQLSEEELTRKEEK